MESNIKVLLQDFALLRTGNLAWIHFVMLIRFLGIVSALSSAEWWDGSNMYIAAGFAVTCVQDMGVFIFKDRLQIETIPKWKVHWYNYTLAGGCAYILLAQDQAPGSWCVSISITRRKDQKRAGHNSHFAHHICRGIKLPLCEWIVLHLCGQEVAHRADPQVRKQ